MSVSVHTDTHEVCTPLQGISKPLSMCPRIPRSQVKNFCQNVSQQERGDKGASQREGRCELCWGIGWVHDFSMLLHLLGLSLARIVARQLDKSVFRSLSSSAAMGLYETFTSTPKVRQGCCCCSCWVTKVVFNPFVNS